MGKKPKQKELPDVVDLSAKPEPKVIIGMGCQDIIHSSTAHAIGCAIIGNSNIVDFLMYKGCDIVSARTWLVRQALKTDATHLLFVDSDIMFPPDAIQKLLAHDKDIVGVEYNKRKFPLEKVTKPLEEASETELYKGKVLGTGLMLIRLSIFKNPAQPMGEPWFNFGRDSQGGLVLGEDAWFVNTARDAGYESWIDPTIKCLHLGEYGY